MASSKPLSGHALRELRRVEVETPPRQTLNPGVTRRLARDGLIEAFLAPTIYASQRGLIQFVRITAGGRALLSRTSGASDD